MSTDFSQFLRAVYKEFHVGGRYYKGKGREMLEWMIDEYPWACYFHFERADGGRQDLDYDAAVPIYMNAPFMLRFLHRFVHLSDHSNQLEDFLYSALRSVEFLAMVRANALVDVLISRPLRWLAGKQEKLTSWSPAKSTWALDLVEQTLERASVDGAVLLEPQLDIFAPIAAEQPLFRKYQLYTYRRAALLSPNRLVSHQLWKQARAELLTPSSATNRATTQKTIVYLEVQAAAGLRKFHDTNLVLAEKLTSQDGANCIAKTSQMHSDLLGCTGVNDGLSESVFGVFDRARLVNPGISQPAASALTQARRMKSFSHGDSVQHRKHRKDRTEPQLLEDGEGYFYTLPKHEAIALVEMGRVSRQEMRKIDAADAAEHTTYVKAKRKSEIEEELEKVIKQFGLAVTFFDRWKARAVRTVGALSAKLRSDFNEPDARKREQLKLNWLREQIQMRVLGFNWTEFKTNWCSGNDEHVGTAEQLAGHLKEIIAEEIERDRAGELPEAACAPIMHRKVFKPLGTLTPDAAELTSPFVELIEEQLLARVAAESQRLLAAGEIDDIEDAQPPDEDAPELDSGLVGWEIDVRWRY